MSGGHWHIAHHGSAYRIQMSPNWDERAALAGRRVRGCKGQALIRDLPGLRQDALHSQFDRLQQKSMSMRAIS